MSWLKTRDQDTRALWDGRASRWDQIYSGSGGLARRAWDRLTRRNIIRRFQRCFEAFDVRQRDVLDLGCGSGHYVLEAANRGAGRVVGIDISPVMVAMAQELLSESGVRANVELSCRNLWDADLARRFDLVIAMGLFDYTDDPPELMCRIAAWCRGGLVASFPHRLSLRWLPRSIVWRERGVTLQLYSKSRIRDICARSGFHVQSLERIGPVYHLVAEAAESPRQ